MGDDHAHASRRDPGSRLDDLAARAGLLGDPRRSRCRRDQDRRARRRGSRAGIAPSRRARDGRPAELLLHGQQPQQAWHHARSKKARSARDHLPPRQDLRRVRTELSQGRRRSTRDRLRRLENAQPAYHLREREWLRPSRCRVRLPVFRLPRASALRDHARRGRARHAALRDRRRHRRPDGRDPVGLRRGHGASCP